jgi:hypothetical protein
MHSFSVCTAMDSILVPTRAACLQHPGRMLHLVVKDALNRIPACVA